MDMLNDMVLTGLLSLGFDVLTGLALVITVVIYEAGKWLLKRGKQS